MTDPSATGRLWTLTLLAPCPWITDNDVLGKLHKYARARLVRTWRKTMVDCCRAGNLPCGDQRLDRIRVEGSARFRGRPPVRDGNAGSLHHTLKAVIDGLTPPRTYGKSKQPSPGWGLIRDDSDKHLESSSIRIGEPLPKTVIADHPGLLVVTITELVPVNALF